MPRPRPRHAQHRRRPASNGMGLVCVVAAVALAAVMGVSALRNRKPPSRVPKAVYVPEPRYDPDAARPPAPPPEPSAPLDVLARTVREAEKNMPVLRRTSRGPGFEEARVALLSQVAQARDELGTYLDAHPSSDRANDLWDEVLRLYIALQKL